MQSSANTFRSIYWRPLENSTGSALFLFWVVANLLSGILSSAIVKTPWGALGVLVIPCADYSDDAVACTPGTGSPRRFVVAG